MTKLQEVDPLVERSKSTARNGKSTDRNFSMFKPGFEAFQFASSGKYYFRLLGQPIGAKHSWYVTVPYMYFDALKTPGLRGVLPLTEAQENFLASVRSQAYKDPIFGNRMKKNANPNGLDLGTKYRNAFMGFVYNDTSPEVKPIILPASNPKQKEGRIQVGTQITQYMYEVDINGNLKYGSIVNSETGKLVCLEVSGEGTRREYKSSVELTLAPITEPKYAPLIDQVVAFEDIICYVSNEDFLGAIQARLPVDMHALLLKTAAITPGFNVVPTKFGVEGQVKAESHVLDLTPPAQAPAQAPAQIPAPVQPPAQILAPSNSEPVYKRYGFANMEEFRLALVKDPSFLNKG